MNQAAAPSAADNLHRLAGILADFVRVMGEQAEFHTGEHLVHGANAVRDAAALAERRLATLDIAGERWRRGMEKTMLAAIARAAAWADAVLAEAGAEAWPDLTDMAGTARAAVREAALRDPGLFAPAKFNAAAIEKAPPAPFGAPPGWREAARESYVAIEGGIPMTVAAWGAGADKSWVAQVGGIGIGFFPTPEEAAEKAVAGHAAWFGASSTPPDDAATAHGDA